MSMGSSKMGNTCSDCKFYDPLGKEEREAYMSMFDGHCRLNGDVIYEDDTCDKFEGNGKG